MWSVAMSYWTRRVRLRSLPGRHQGLSSPMPSLPHFRPSWRTLSTPRGRQHLRRLCQTCCMHVGSCSISFSDSLVAHVGRPGLSFPSDSILYKTKLPFVLVFNKTDVASHEFAIEWMQDFEAFQAALASHSGSRDADGEPTYMNSLMNSMSLVLDEFYKHLKVSV